MTGFPYSKILARGTDAFDFLQAQLSNDLRLLEERPQIVSAWCNPKGRVICIFRVSRSDDGYTLVLPAELAETVLKRLTLFRFRSRVDLEPAAASPDDLGIAGDSEDWLLDNLLSGIPEVWQAQSEEFTPHMLNLDLVGAVSFDKGCYPGQEIVARTHYRGASRRRTHRFESAQPLSAGDKVSDGERDIGEVVNAIGTDLLAVVPSEKAGETLSANGVEIRHIPLPYA
jgi:folate-binding protein YgfZ